MGYSLLRLVTSFLLFLVGLVGSQLALATSRYCILLPVGEENPVAHIVNTAFSYYRYTWQYKLRLWRVAWLGLVRKGKNPTEADSFGRQNICLHDTLKEKLVQESLYSKQPGFLVYSRGSTCSICEELSPSNFMASSSTLVCFTSSSASASDNNDTSFSFSITSIVELSLAFSTSSSSSSSSSSSWSSITLELDEICFDDDDVDADADDQ
ncbi:hypothetical protein V2J09_014827 [Rumex salicifolius]